MVNFNRNEIVSATQLVRNFSSFINNLIKKKIDKLPSFFIWAGVDSNHRTLSGTDLQSVAFSHSATYPY